MPPEFSYLLAVWGVLVDRWRTRPADAKGMTTLEYAILAGGAAIVAASVVAAIRFAVNKHIIDIK